MKNGNSKGGFAIVVILISIFLVLTIFIGITDFIGMILSYPVVYYGLPVALLLYLYLSNRNSTDKNIKDKD